MLGVLLDRSGLLLLALASCLSVASIARADELRDFEAARSKYEAQDYAGAVVAFEGLLDQQPPRLSRPLLELESRKYLAASLLFQLRQDEARIQLGKLLVADPSYEIDPLAFPNVFIQLFRSIQGEYQEVIEAQRARAGARATDTDPDAPARPPEWEEHLDQLREIARTSEAVQENSRLVSLMPFGLGQIQNGDLLLGASLAVLEVGLLSATVATFLIHQDMRSYEVNPSEVSTLESTQRTLQILNYTSFGSFLAVASGGVVHAQLRYQPRIVRRVPRALPEDLERWLDALASSGLRLEF